jgi:multicomponent Na+:H+ antiporter subunit D
VIQAGGIFTSSYVLLVIVHALAPAARPLTLRGPVPRYQEAAALALALCSALLGLLPWPLDISFAQRTPWDLLTLTAFSTSLWPILSGALVAILLGRRGLQLTRVPSGKALLAMVRPLRQVALVVGMAIERTDRLFRRWPVACLSLLALVVLFGAALMADR